MQGNKGRKRGLRARDSELTRSRCQSAERTWAAAERRSSLSADTAASVAGGAFLRPAGPAMPAAELRVVAASALPAAGRPTLLAAASTLPASRSSARLLITGRKITNQVPQATNHARLIVSVPDERRTLPADPNGRGMQGTGGRVLRAMAKIRKKDTEVLTCIASC